MFNVTTTGKPFTWSYTRLKNFRTCPKRHWHVDIEKDFKEEEGTQLKWGNDVHAAMEARIKRGTPLPPSMRDYEPEVLKVLQHMPEGTVLLCEEKSAFTKDFRACAYFDRDVWYRSKCDVVKIRGIIAVAIDWKTGKIQEDSEQLALMAQWVFSAYPEVQAVKTRYVWLGSNAQTDCTFKRTDMVTLWNHLWPELQLYENAVRTVTFPPKPGRLCRRYCPVTSCPYHGKGSQ